MKSITWAAIIQTLVFSFSLRSQLLPRIESYRRGTSSALEYEDIQLRHPCHVVPLDVPLDRSPVLLGDGALLNENVKI
jgi:hypothetical protein